MRRAWMACAVLLALVWAWAALGIGPAAQAAPGPLILGPYAVLLPGASEGEPYHAQLQASGGEPPYRWAAEGLPPGLSIDPDTGVISGTPAEGTADLRREPYRIRVRVTDSSGASVRAGSPFTGSGELLLLVYPALRITTAGFPLAAVGRSVAWEVETNAGPQGIAAYNAREVPPYRWRVSSGRLPPGLSLRERTGGPSTVIFGTPTRAGRCRFTLEVTDGAGHRATRTYAAVIRGRSSEGPPVPGGASSLPGPIPARVDPLSVAVAVLGLLSLALRRAGLGRSAWFADLLGGGLLAVQALKASWEYDGRGAAEAAAGFVLFGLSWLLPEGNLAARAAMWAEGSLLGEDGPFSRLSVWLRARVDPWAKRAGRAVRRAVRRIDE